MSHHRICSFRCSLVGLIAIILYFVDRTLAQLESYVPDEDYPIYTEVPLGLSFTCDDKIPGYYADPEARCQVWHWCVPGIGGNDKYSFICAPGTVFNQRTRVCDYFYKVDCPNAPAFYAINEDLYKDEAGNYINGKKNNYKQRILRSKENRRDFLIKTRLNKKRLIEEKRPFDKRPTDIKRSLRERTRDVRIFLNENGPFIKNDSETKGFIDLKPFDRTRPNQKQRLIRKNDSLAQRVVPLLTNKDQYGPNISNEISVSLSKNSLNIDRKVSNDDENLVNDKEPLNKKRLVSENTLKTENKPVSENITVARIDSVNDTKNVPVKERPLGESFPVAEKNTIGINFYNNYSNGSINQTDI